MTSGYNAIYRNDTDLYSFISSGPTGGVINATTVNCNFLNSGFVVCDQIDRNTPGDLQINNDTLLVGDLTLDGNLDLVENAGKLQIINATLSGSSGSISGQHLQVMINGVNYKIELKNP